MRGFEMRGSGRGSLTNKESYPAQTALRFAWDLYVRPAESARIVLMFVSAELFDAYRDEITVCYRTGMSSAVSEGYYLAYKNARVLRGPSADCWHVRNVCLID